jgi:hypothetical protein
MDRYRTGSRPPSWPLVVSLAGVATSVALAVLGDTMLSSPVLRNGIGWAAGALVPMVSLVRYRLRVRKLRTRTDYSFTRWANRAVTLTTAFGIVIGIWHGWYLASWLASP